MRRSEDVEAEPTSDQHGFPKSNALDDGEFSHVALECRHPPWNPCSKVNSVQAAVHRPGGSRVPNTKQCSFFLKIVRRSVKRHNVVLSYLDSWWSGIEGLQMSKREERTSCFVRRRNLFAEPEKKARLCPRE